VKVRRRSPSTFASASPKRSAHITEGEVKMRVNDALDADEIADGWVLTCQSEPVTPDVTVTYDD
jgi:hypothetical protein